MSLRHPPVDAMAEMVAQMVVAYTADKAALDPLLWRCPGLRTGDRLVSFLLAAVPAEQRPMRALQSAMADAVEVLLEDGAAAAASHEGVLAEIARCGGVLQLSRQARHRRIAAGLTADAAAPSAIGDC